MARRIKQLSIDCLADGAPWAVRVVYVTPRPDPEDETVTEEVQRVREIEFAKLPAAVQAAVQAFIDTAETTIDAAVVDEREQREARAAEDAAREAAREAAVAAGGRSVPVAEASPVALGTRM